MPARLPGVRLREGADAATADAEAVRPAKARDRRQPAGRFGAPARCGEGLMSTIAQPALPAQPAPAASRVHGRRALDRPRRRAARRRRRDQRSRAAAQRRSSTACGTTAPSSRRRSPRRARSCRARRRTRASRPRPRRSSAWSRPIPNSTTYLRLRTVNEDRRANSRIRLLVAGVRRAVRGDARPGGVDPGRRRLRVRGDGVEAAAGDDRDPRGPRHDLRPDRRAARDRRAGDDGLRRSAPRRRPEEGRGQGRRRLLGVDPDELYPASRDRTKRFVYVERKADPVKAKALQRLGVAGIGFYPEERRTYPQGRVAVAAARVRGYGQPRPRRPGGHARQEARQAGPATRSSSATRPARRSTSSRRGKERPGKNVVLTLDHQLQATAEQLLATAVQRWARKGRRRSSMDPRTGAILAMANAPTFDANTVRSRSGGGAAQPRRDRPLRAGVDVQDRHDRRRAGGQHRHARDRRSRSRRRSRSPTA